MNMRPLYDRVVIERKEEEAKTAGGIFLPDNAKEKPIFGSVVAVGAGKVLENGQVSALQVKVGDVVVIGKYAGTEVKLDGKEYVVLREDDIMAVIAD